MSIERLGSSGPKLLPLFTDEVTLLVGTLESTSGWGQHLEPDPQPPGAFEEVDVPCEPLLAAFGPIRSRKRISGSLVARVRLTITAEPVGSTLCSIP